MNIIKFLIIIIIANLFTNCKVYQSENTVKYSRNKTNITNNKYGPGNCYAKCLIPNKYQFLSEPFAIFTGNEKEEQVAIEIREIVLKPKTKKWEKKKAEGNCRSADPNDCLVWCLTEVPPITKEIKILIDTTQSSNYELKRFSYEEVNEEDEQRVGWIDVLCEKDITKSVLGQIQNSLREKGYYNDENTYKLDKKTKSALKYFQKDNNLPIGNLDFDTLYDLGVKTN